MALSYLETLTYVYILDTYIHKFKDENWKYSGYFYIICSSITFTYKKDDEGGYSATSSRRQWLVDMSAQPCMHNAIPSTIVVWKAGGGPPVLEIIIKITTKLKQCLGSSSKFKSTF